MEHLGDITRLDGRNLPVVDVITGGSPCQDLSIAGKQAGLSGERSGLFLEQIRIVKELREGDRQHGRTDELIRPRFMLWENVPGAFSSNRGRDFQRVLSECVRIAEPSAPDVPMPEKGKWTKAGVLVGNGWSLAWRVLNAQYWGVPQRRRRIALVCDFRGQSAGEILFKRESVSGHIKPRRASGQGITGSLENCAYPAVARSLTARYDGSPCVDRGPNIVVTPINTMVATRHKALGRGTGFGIGRPGDPAFTISTAHSHAVFDARGNGNGETVCTLTGDHANRVTDYTPIVASYKSFGEYQISESAKSLLASDDVTTSDLVCAGIIRRLTPLECERLQGFPDNYTDIGDWADDSGTE